MDELVTGATQSDN